MNRENTDGKEICFVSTDNIELFRVPNGGFITITHANGEQQVRRCVYYGTSAFVLDNHSDNKKDLMSNYHHAVDFAEIMERKGSTYAPCPEPEINAGYMITDRMPAKNKVYVLAHNPQAVQPWVTWQAQNDHPGYDWGHYWSNRPEALSDYFKRADAERTGRTYDHTKAYKQPKKRDNGAR